MPREKLEKHDADGIEVGPSVAAVSLDLFGRHVVRRPGGVAQIGIRDAVRPFRERQTEIEYHGLTVGTDEYVLGLDVAVDDIVLMAVRQSVGDLPYEGYRRPGLHRRRALHKLPHRFASDKLRHKIRGVVEPPRPEALLDRRMTQRPHYLQLALEALILRRVTDDRLVRNLERNFPAVQEIDRPVDIAHPPLCDMPLDLEVVKLVTYLEHRGGVSCSGSIRHRSTPHYIENSLQMRYYGRPGNAARSSQSARIAESGTDRVTAPRAG